jgi:hypothetical protein
VTHFEWFITVVVCLWILWNAVGWLGRVVDAYEIVKHEKELKAKWGPMGTAWRFTEEAQKRAAAETKHANLTHSPYLTHSPGCERVQRGWAAACTCGVDERAAKEKTS